MSEALELAKKVESQGLDTEVAMRLARLVIERETPVRPASRSHWFGWCFCGAALNHHWRFCPNCGKRLDWGTTA